MSVLIKIMLDSNAINFINGILKQSPHNAKAIKSHLNKKGAILCVTWIQIQETGGGSHKPSEYDNQIEKFEVTCEKYCIDYEKIPAIGYLGGHNKMKSIPTQWKKNQVNQIELDKILFCKKDESLFNYLVKSCLG